MRAPKVFDVRKGGVLSPDANKIVLFNWNLFTVLLFTCSLFTFHWHCSHSKNMKQKRTSLVCVEPLAAALIIC